MKRHVPLPRWLYRCLGFVSDEPDPPWCGKYVLKFAYRPVELSCSHCDCLGKIGPKDDPNYRYWSRADFYVHWRWIAYMQTTFAGSQPQYYWDGDLWVACDGDAIDTKSRIERGQERRQREKAL